MLCQLIVQLDQQLDGNRSFSTNLILNRHNDSDKNVVPGFGLATNVQLLYSQRQRSSNTFTCNKMGCSETLKGDRSRHAQTHGLTAARNDAVETLRNYNVS